VIPEEKSVITIEQVRVVSTQAALHAYEGTTKVWILDPADQMQEAAANAFLKTLEEPASRTLFILLTTAMSALLPTIRSRCQEVRFDPLPEPALQTILHRHGWTAIDAARAAGLAGGSAERALALDVEEEQVARAQLVTEVWGALESLPTLLDTAERLGKDRVGLEEALETLQAVTRDAAVGRIEHGLVPDDRWAVAEQVLGMAPLATVLRISQAQAEARRRLSLNAQPRFVAEHLLLAMRAAMEKGSRNT
jgi:DNA polymerase-3 subunit delta'